jgi:heptosyltransferase-2
VEELYQGCEAVDETLTYDHGGIHRGTTGFVRLVGTLRKPRFDLALLFPNAFRAAAVVWAARIPKRWGYGTDGRGFLLTRSVPPAPRPFGRHQAYYYLDLMRALGISADYPNCSLGLTAAMKELGSQLLSRNGWGPRDTLVGIHPGATNSSAKRWIPERFAEVGDRLVASHGVKLVLLGGRKEVELANAVRSLMRSPSIFLAGETSLEEFMGVLDPLALLLTNDSGPMHLASALGVPTVAIFGPTDERETGPMGKQARIVRKHVECSPCLLRVCPTDHRCMRRIEVDEVYEAAVSSLADRAGHKTAEAVS